MQLGQVMAEKNCVPIRFGSTSILIVLLIISSCSGNYGRLLRNQQINEIFKTYRVLPDHRYYFSGPEGRPDAIMGIQRDYTLETTQWTEIDLTEKQLKKLIDWINFHHHSRTRYYPYGYAILDHNGNQVGIWYSIWDWTTVRVEADKRVKIFPPAIKDRFGNGDEPRRMIMD
jgi:hypothetical protein